MISTRDLFAVVEGVLGTQRRFTGNYRDVVRAVADGKPPEPDSIARVLQDNGKTVADLQAAVELLNRRRGLRKVMDEAAVLEKERVKVVQQLEEANRLLEQAEELHLETYYPLSYRLDDIKRAASATKDARRELMDTCDDPALLGELADTQTELAALSLRRQELSQKRDELRNAGRNDLQEAGSGQDTDSLRQRGDGRLSQAKSFEPEIARLDKKLVNLQEREQSIRERMLQV